MGQHAQIYPHMVLTRGFLQTLSCVCVCLCVCASVRLCVRPKQLCVSSVYKTRQNIFYKAWFFSKKKTLFLECSRTNVFFEKISKISKKIQNSRFVVYWPKSSKNLFFSKKSYFHRIFWKSRSPTSEILKSSDFGKKFQNFKILVSSFSDLKVLKIYFFIKIFFSSDFLKKSFPNLRNLKIVGFWSKRP